MQAAADGTSLPRFDGWLTKNKQRRFFVSEDVKLTWMDNPQAAVNGSLDLRDYFVELRDKGGTRAEIVLTPREKGGSTSFVGKKNKSKAKKYVLADKNGAVIARWYEHLDRVVKSQIFMKAAEELPPAFEARTSMALLDGPPLGAPPKAPGLEESNAYSLCPSKSGWLMKKAKMRFFVLRDGMLYWFSNEVRPGSDLVAAEPNGCVDLTDCDVRAGPTQQQPKHATPYNLAFQERGSEEVYVVTAKTDEDACDWVKKLVGAATWATAQIEKLQKTLAGVAPSSIRMRGYLSKKGDRRYFQIKDGVLAWWDNERACQSGVGANGSLKLSGASVSYDDKKPRTFVIINRMAQFRYVLTAHYKMQFEQWVLAVQRVTSADPHASGNIERITTVELCGVVCSDSTSTETFAPSATPRSSKGGETVGWMSKKGKRRFFVLRDAVLMWFASESDAVQARRGNAGILPKNTLAVNRCKVELAVDGFTLTITSPSARVYRLTAPTSDEARMWLTSLRSSSVSADDVVVDDRSAGSEVPCEISLQLSGFAEKKGKRRYFCADAEEGTLSWWNSTDDYTTGKRANNFLPLAGSSVAASDALSILIVQSRGETYRLTFANAVEREKWVATLQCVIANANARVDAGYVHSGWCEKKGSRRWFVLTSEGVLLWFDQAQPFRNITPARANGFLQVGALGGVDVKFDTMHPTVFALEGSRSGSYRLKTRTPEECAAWRSAIRGVKQNAHLSNSSDAKCFGIPLEQLTPSSTVPHVPQVIVSMTSFIAAYGSELQGIFRLSAGSELVSSFRRQLQSDDLATPWSSNVFDDTVHAVAASLKSLLRDLPEPLVPFSLYRPLLKVNPRDESAIASVLAGGLAKKEPVFAATLRYVCEFIARMRLHSATTNMDSSNLAIVFAPNMIRAPANNSDTAGFSANGLADTPLVLGVFRSMIERVDSIWQTIDNQSGMVPTSNAKVERQDTAQLLL